MGLYGLVLKKKDPQESIAAGENRNRSATEDCPENASFEACFSCTYGRFNEFQNLVCSRLEGGRRGSEFPVLQGIRPEVESVGRLECEGSAVTGLLSEVARLREELHQVELLALKIEDGGDAEYLLANTLLPGHRHLPVLRDDELGWDIDVDEGSVLVTFRCDGEPRVRSALIQREGSRYRSAEGKFVELGVDLGDKLLAAKRNGLDEYSGLLDGLEALCVGSIRAKNPIVFS